MLNKHKYNITDIEIENKKLPDNHLGLQIRISNEWMIKSS